MTGSAVALPATPMNNNPASEGGFDEATYLRRYEDVARAVARGAIPSGRFHFEHYGRKEGRSGAPGLPRLGARWWIEEPGDTDRLGRYGTALSVRTLSDLNTLILRNLPRFSGIADLIAGVPRSGLLAANILALHLNLPLVTLDALLARRTGQLFTRRRATPPGIAWPGSKITGGWKPRVLVIDDSIGSGTTFRQIAEEIDKSGIAEDFEISYLTIYSTSSLPLPVDYLEILDHPRVFEWNIMHHDYTRRFCVDMDGVLCVDPSVEENDEDQRYSHFLDTAAPFIVPSRGVGAIVTARLERYRTQTEAWLKRHSVRYERLIMLDLPSGAERRRLGAHAPFKADVYRELGGLLFVESDMRQAQEIFALSGMPVYCPATSTFFH